jgi:hypothetical protein
VLARKVRRQLLAPLTAIQQAERDGNDTTTADPAWTSLRPTPAYPECPSGHGFVSFLGAVGDVVAEEEFATHADALAWAADAEQGEDVQRVGTPGRRGTCAGRVP